MELDEHVPVYVPEPKHPKYHAPSDDDIQEDTDEDYIDYPDEPEDGEKDDDEDPEEDLSEEHEPEDDDEDPEEDPNEDHEPEDEDTKEKDPSEDSDEIEPFEEDETAVTPPPPRHHRARISVRPQTPMAASTQALIDAFVAGSPLFPLTPTSPAYDQASLVHRAVMICIRDDILEEDMPPQKRFILTAPPPGCDVAESFATAVAARAPREDVGYVRALQASKHMIMTFIEEVNLRVIYQAQVRRQESADFYTQLLDAQNDRRDIKLEIDVVKGQRTAYETELHERQSAEDLAVTQMMRIHVLEARARTDMVEDADKLALMCTKFLADETVKIDKSIGGLPDNIHGNVMSAKPKTLDFAIELANDLMDQKLHTYVERQNENKRKADDSSRNNQQQPYKKDASLDSNVITGTFLLKNRYAKIMFDTSADRSFVSITFSALIDITPTTLENHYDVELDDGKIIRVNTIIRGCTLNFMNHPFNIDLMHVPLGSFYVIIGMDWSTKYHGVIICDEKIVHVPFRREMLIFQGNGDNQREESRLNIISCTKAQEYLSKGCDVFLAYITTKEAKDKSKWKRLREVPIVRDFPKDLPGIPPARQVELQIDLVPGVAPVARAPYRLAPSEMKELTEQLQELSDK
uniref:Putative reverse transcriptase domain-containing protein n=1 Tax=Tanacetum cinerariifolium TaxID=118510 RepID=A0A6L2L234_TANCI|nr:putative reverse transcriptase domain-containing protein [Tanacetum cinerariifolium]